ncbi:MAG: hypothetical protein LBO05_04555 [Deltaproteobacteria bacterium]|jgi:hypothetical protein|nr:hypothetical protein [Deltaproteobacteria bacterium]
MSNVKKFVFSLTFLFLVSNFAIFFTSPLAWGLAAPVYATSKEASAAAGQNDLADCARIAVGQVVEGRYLVAAVSASEGIVSLASADPKTAGSRGGFMYKPKRYSSVGSGRTAKPSDTVVEEGADAGERAAESNRRGGFMYKPDRYSSVGSGRTAKPSDTVVEEGADAGERVAEANRKGGFMYKPDRYRHLRKGRDRLAAAAELRYATCGNIAAAASVNN